MAKNYRKIATGQFITFIRTRTKNMYSADFKDANARADGADLRVMSFNVLCEIWNEKATIPSRDSKATATVLHYAPDVMGLQEMSPAWHTALKKTLKGTPYQIICEKNTVSHSVYGYTNFSPIVYNSDTVKSIESGVEAYSAASKKYAYVMSWGYFEKIETGKKFVIINTHFDLRNHGEDYDNNRMKQAKEISALIKQLKKKYGCPVITIGDYNTFESESIYNTIVSGAQVTEAKYSANKINRACATYHTLGSVISTAAANSHDHIFGSDGINFLYYNVLVDKIVIDASDHCPIYADVKLN